MPKTAPQEPTLSQSLQPSGGLKQFREAAQRSMVVGDGPFGPPREKQRQGEGEPKSMVTTSSLADAATEMQLAGDAASCEDVNAKLDAAELMENVTLPLTETLRDRTENLARVLNRSRSIRKCRLTRNSVIRVAIQRFLEDFALAPGQSINSEEELLVAARSLHDSK